MRTLVMIELGLCWFLWFFPFWTAKKKHSRPSVVTDSLSRYGVLLQFASYALAFTYSNEPRSYRLIAAAALAPATVVFTWYAVRHLGKQWRIQAGLYADHELVTTGPYRLVRHPVYLSMIGMWAASAFTMTTWTMTALSFALMIAGTEVRVHAEDKLLAKRFGNDFARYRGRVWAYLPPLR